MARTVAAAVILAATSVAVTSPACTSGSGREDVAIGRLATVLCDVLVECECAQTGVFCEDWQQLEPLGTFDEACLEVWTQWAESLECGVSALPDEALLCPLYHGTIYEGMPCTGSIDGSGFSPLTTPCGRGLVCVSGLCRNPGAVAFGAPGQPCELGSRCDQGLYCQRRDDLRACERIPGADEPCPDRVCQDGYVCDEICMRLPSEGDRCIRGECAEGLGCEGNVCVRRAAVGQPCMGHRECVSNNCPAGSCAPVPEPGDPCSGTLPCGPDQACIASVCEQVVEGDDAGGEDLLVSTCDLVWSL